MMMHIQTIKPSGWIKDLMEKEVQKHVIHRLPQLVPTIFNDDIFKSDRIGRHTKPKDLGTLENDDSWNAQLYWWNSETIGNYYDGCMRYGFMLENTQIIKDVRAFVKHILSSQDTDGYIGIYTQDTRYRFTSENGELWAKTTIGRFLLGYYQYTKEMNVLQAVIRMTENLMNHFKKDASFPFSGKNTFAGVAHGLMFVDVLYELYEITQSKHYIDYAIFLYEDYNRSDTSEPDCLIKNLMDSSYRFQGHGVHTYEHLRAVAIYDHFSGLNGVLYRKYMEKLQWVLSPSGGPIGDEWIMKGVADAGRHGYEFCSIHELMTSLIFVSKLGLDNQYALVEKIYYNANMGTHHQKHQTIAYLKSDDSYAMMGKFQYEQPHSPHKVQTRYKYSPTHQDAAVCCVPNAGRVSPYFIHGMLSIQDEKVVIHYVLPVEIQLTMDSQSYYLHIHQSRIHDAFDIETNIPDGNLIMNVQPLKSIEIKHDLHDRIYFEYNGLVFAYPIQGVDKTIKKHLFGLEDMHVLPKKPHIPLIYRGDKPMLRGTIHEPKIEVVLYQENEAIQAILIPMGQTNLRQVTFEKEIFMHHTQGIK